MVDKGEIRANDYNLNIPRYVDSSNKLRVGTSTQPCFGGIPTSW